jgi:hypothetical protein
MISRSPVRVEVPIATSAQQRVRCLDQPADPNPERDTPAAPAQHLTGRNEPATPQAGNRVVKRHRKGDNGLDGRDVTMITTSRERDVNGAGGDQCQSPV